MITMVAIGRFIVSPKKSHTSERCGSPRVFAVLLAVLFVCGTVMLCVSGCQRESFEAFVTGPFDTVTKMILFSDDQSEFDEHRRFVEQELWRYHQLFDVYNDYPGVTNIKTINDRAGSAVACSEDLLDLIEFGIECEDKSDGRVNVALGSVLILWHEARTNSTAEPSQAYVPDQQVLEDAARHTSIEDVRIDREKGTVTLMDPLMRLDVGAIAKGYAVEKIACALVRRGIRAGALDAGGNIRVIGQNVVKNSPWRIGIRNPLEDSDGSFVEIVDVVNRSVVTSGNDQRYFVFEGRRYSHIIDPATNHPAEYHDAVSVIAEDSGVADFLSTTLMLMTEADGRELLVNFPGCEALWVRGSTVTMTDGFKEYAAGH
ncbi:MAG TPA: FAD:protein FMN transferase [Bacillota bacterium]|jgi:thiamine biosynthesis lipoprotein|nr:FAD:protein FMN transferase [Bacillota bacterium]HQC48179.1 FAD:protein FMN transferase [Bacillota bacterium]